MSEKPTDRRELVGTNAHDVRKTTKNPERITEPDDEYLRFHLGDNFEQVKT